jgi:hypothetical protein
VYIYIYMSVWVGGLVGIACVHEAVYLLHAGVEWWTSVCVCLCVLCVECMYIYINVGGGLVCGFVPVFMCV